MAVPSDFFVDLDETKPEGLSQNVVEAVCVLGWGRRIVGRPSMAAADSKKFNSSFCRYKPDGTLPLTVSQRCGGPNQVCGPQLHRHS
jgi:hypothetical protein